MTHGTFKMGSVLSPKDEGQAAPRPKPQRRNYRAERLQTLAERAAKAQSVQVFVAELAREGLRGGITDNERVFEVSRSIRGVLLDILNMDAWTKYRSILKGLRKEFKRLACTLVAAEEGEIDFLLAGWGPNGDDLRECAGVVSRLPRMDWDMVFKTVRQVASGQRWPVWATVKPWHPMSFRHRRMAAEKDWVKLDLRLRRMA